MRLLCLLMLFFSGAALADDALKFGGQLSGNSYQISDPDGLTSRGSGLAFGANASYELGRNARLFLDVNKGAFSLAASTINVGQDVSMISGGVSYQKMWRMTREIKPWVGVGLGYVSSTYTNRAKLTSSGLFSIPYADYSKTDLAVLFNANNEWQIDHDWGIGLQGQFASVLSGKGNTLRLGMYFFF